MADVSRRSRGCLWAVIAAQALLLVIVVSAVCSGLLARGFGKARGPSGDWGEDEFPEMQEVWSEGQGDAKVVRIPIHGVIFLQEGSGLFGEASGAATALQSIRRATLDTDVRAIILDIDSGGGGVTASDILYQALLRFKASDPQRKVVAVFGDVAASGAYYLAMAADHIVAHPTTITGSIGVLMQSLNFKGLGDKVGVKDVTIKSAENKDLLNPLGELTPEQRALLQGVVDELYTRFVSLVAKGRRLPEDEIRKVADGQVFTAAKGLEYGLVDQIGYWEDAVRKAAELLGEKAVKVYRYEAHFSLSRWLQAGGFWQPVTRGLRPDRDARFLYRWSP